MEMSTRKQVRLPNFDYSENGYYFVTVCSCNRQNIFVDYKVRVGAGISRIYQIRKKQ